MLGEPTEVHPIRDRDAGPHCYSDALAPAEQPTRSAPCGRARAVLFDLVKSQEFHRLFSCFIPRRQLAYGPFMCANSRMYCCGLSHRDGIFGGGQYHIFRLTCIIRTVMGLARLTPGLPHVIRLRQSAKYPLGMPGVVPRSRKWRIHSSSSSVAGVVRILNSPVCRMLFSSCHPQAATISGLSDAPARAGAGRLGQSVKERLWLRFGLRTA